MTLLVHRVLTLLVTATAILAAACGETSTSPSSVPSTASSTARYRATLEATWSGTTHPVDLPADPHFSPLVGGTHNAQATFWRAGDLATPGIQNMAERGQTSTLAQEIQAAVAGGRAGTVFTGSGQFSSPGSAAVEFDINQTFPLLTLVSMIAPSPDWFVGVSGLSLFQNGAWTSEVRVDLDPWDAGTDGGSTFESPDLPLSPHVPVSRIVTAPLSPGGRVTPLGRLVVVRMQ
jgi:hypothetical protein